MDDDLPNFRNLAKNLANEKGESVEDFLKRLSTTAHESSYPTPECLDPVAVERFFFGENLLTADQRAHINSCETCAGSVRAAQPTPDGIERMLEHVRNRAP